jgi:hypothetical protein
VERIVAGHRSIREWFSQTTIHIATDATWILIIVLVLSLSSSAFSIRYLSGLESDIADLYENNIKGQTYAQNAYVDLLEIESAAKDFVFAEDQQARFASAAGLAGNFASLQSFVLRVTHTLNATKYKSLIARSKQDVTTLVDSIRNRLDDSLTIEQGRRFLNDLPAIAMPLRNDIITINDIKRNANSSGLRAVRIQLRISLVITIVLLLISVAVRIFLYRSSRRTLRKTLQ